MPFTKEQHREYRQYLTKLGICPRCHKREAGEGRKICMPCQEANLKQRKEYRKEKTRCGDCVNKLGEFDIYAGRNLCPKCLEMKRINKIRRTG